MFDYARLKLTAWYVLILMSVSLIFSLAFFQVSTKEIQVLIDRIEYDERHIDTIIFKRPHLPPHILTLDELYTVKNKIALNLMFINIGILLVAGGASYFLAGKTLQPIKEMLDEQNQFITDASHELRTPIATLRAEMEASLLEKKLSDSQARKLIKSNLEELSTLQDLANKLLVLAQFQPQAKEVSTEKVALIPVLQKTIKKITPLAKEKKISIVSNLTDNNVNPTILGSAGELQELFIILLDNAVKYSPKNQEITITVTILKSIVQVAISDHGIGIELSEQKNIFKRFYRADKSRSQADGYGLGLAIAKKIVTNHQGSITVVSSPKTGSTFTVELPLTK